MCICVYVQYVLEERQLRCICYYGDYEEGYDVDFGCPQATEQQKTITDHSRNVIVILYIVFVLNMVNILKVCTCNQKFLFAHIYCKLLFFMFVCIDCYLQIVKSCTDWTDCTFCLSIQKKKH